MWHRLWSRVIHVTRILLRRNHIPGPGHAVAKASALPCG